MSYVTRLSTASAFALFTATPSVADISAAEVWADWQDYMNSYGFSTSVGTVTNLGGALTITDFVASMALPEGSFEQSIGEIVMQEQGDGTVMITMSPSYPLSLRMRPAGEPSVDADLTVTTQNMAIIASGDVGNTTYTFDADQMGITLDEARSDGEKQPVEVDVTMRDFNGAYTVSGEGTRRISQRVNIGAMAVAASGSEDGASFIATVNANTLAMTGNGTLLNMAANPDISVALRDGAQMEGTFTHGPISYALDAKDPTQATKIKGTATSGDLTFGLSDEGFLYGGGSRGVEMTVSGSQIPFPEVKLGIADSGFNIKMPLLKTDPEASEDFEFALNLADVTISDQIWGMFDPFGQLPRDPASIALDLSGQVGLFLDLLDPENANTPDLGAPGELRALTIKDLLISAVGAQLTGQGDFTFNNSDTTTFQGMPAPTGKATMQMSGADGLIETLGKMGILPAEQAMGARMMLGLFARPGPSPDTLTSTIEVKGDGSISANGQRIR